MQALIVGAAGFVGRHLAAHLSACGDVVDGVVSLRAAEDLSLPNVERVFRWDVSQPLPAEHPLAEHLRRCPPDAVYHLAAISLPAQCGDQTPTATAQAVNVDGVEHALRAAAVKRSNRPPPKFVLVGSSHVYAPVSRAAPRVDEQSPVGPNKAYGATKWEAERRAWAVSAELAAADRPTAVVVARAFNHTGPGQEPHYMLPSWARQLAEGRTELRLITRDAQLDLTDVRDVARAYRLLALHGQAGMAYNVGSGVQRSSGDVLRRLLELAQVELSVVETDPGWRQGPVADITRLVAATGWRPEVAFDQTLQDVLDDWRRRTGKPAEPKR